MDKKLPPIFKNEQNKRIENNKLVFYSKHESIGNVIEDSNRNEKINDNVSKDNSLEELLNNNHYIFNIPLEITLKDEVINTKLISKVGDHLLTNNNRIINLEDILSIKLK